MYCFRHYRSQLISQEIRLSDDYKSHDRGHHHSVPYEYLSRLEDIHPHAQNSAF